MVGMDASQRMLEISKKLEIYSDLRHLYLGCGQVPEEFFGQFEIATACAGFLPNHLPPQTFVEMLQCVKTNGYIIYSLRDSYYQDASLGFKAKMDELLAEGKIKLVKQHSWKKYEGMENVEGMGLFVPDVCHVFAFQK